MTTTITGKNQITLPAKIVNELGFQAGTKLEWSISSNGDIVGHRLLSRHELAGALAGRGRKYLKRGSDPIRSLIEERVAEDEEEKQ